MRIIRILKNIYLKCKHKYEVYRFDRYIKLYDTYSFNYKRKMANKWLKQYPEQAHFDYDPVKYWFEDIVEKPVSVIEIGGWRGDLAEKALSSFEFITLWHNYDLIKNNNYQKCNDYRYKLISLNGYLWSQPLNNEYNSLIATHMVEHINWKEFTELANWIPECIKTVLFESPLPQTHENYNWKGDHSSHVFEKGWEQVIAEMKNHRFTVVYNIINSVIFKR
ncbi:MAG: hypothetical protein EPN88_16120 [Bacteroidetes bacterium]|nr:MAG: hypothetical protein EPN88_16120 [Bacteroidota bacterium]